MRVTLRREPAPHSESRPSTLTMTSRDSPSPLLQARTPLPDATAVSYALAPSPTPRSTVSATTQPKVGVEVVSDALKSLEPARRVTHRRTRTAAPKDPCRRKGDSLISLDLGACRDADPSVFHPDPETNHATQSARAICARCCVRLECLALALRTDNLDGIWGGLTAAERTRYANADPEHPTRRR